MPPHTTRRDLLHTAWLQAISYASSATTKSGRPRKYPRARAIGAWFANLVAHWLLGHRNMYLTDSRQGVVCLYSSPPIWLILKGTAVFALLILAGLSGVSLIRGPVVVLCVVFMISLTVSVFSGGGHSRAPQGTPKTYIPKKRFTIGLAAAHPAAPPGETLRLARTLIRSLQEGSAVVVHPRTSELRIAYEKFGFVPSKGLAMVLRTEA